MDDAFLTLKPTFAPSCGPMAPGQFLCCAYEYKFGNLLLLVTSAPS